MPDALEWRPSSVAFFARRRSLPVHHPAGPAALPPLSLRSRACGWALAVLALQRFARRPRAVRAHHGARLDRAPRWAREAWDEVWGPLLRGKFGDARRRHRDGLAVEQAAPAPLRSAARTSRQERLGYPRDSWEPLFDALRARDRGARRPRADRPAGRAARAPARLRGRARRARLLPRGPRPARVRGGRRRRALRPRARHRARTTSSRSCSSPASRGGGQAYLGRLRCDRVLRRALPAARARPPVLSPYYWTNVADRALPFVGLIEHTNLIAPERYGGRRFLYVANYLEHGHELLGLDADALLERYQPGLRAVNPAFERALGAGSAGCTREPAAQPIVTVGYARADPAAAHAGVPGSSSPTRRRSIPRTAAPTTPCGSGPTPPRRCSAPRRSRRSGARTRPQPRAVSASVAAGCGADERRVPPHSPRPSGPT